MPDATLGRIQGKGYNNQIEAIDRIRQGVNDSIAQQMQIISSWRDREEAKAERERQREWNAEQAKLSRDYASDEDQKRRDFTEKENTKDRAHKTSENALDRTHKSNENAKDRKSQESMNYLNNQTSRVNTHANYNNTMEMMGYASKDIYGNLIYETNGQVKLTPQGQKKLQETQKPTLQATQPQAEALPPMQRP